jgi:hypothetical protein
MSQGAHPGTSSRTGAGPAGTPPDDLLAPEEIAFLVCVEANRLEPQARMLCESIRSHGGRYRNAPITAVSPRPHLALSAASRRQLEMLGVRHVAQSLNDSGSPYGTINRIVAGAWAEEQLPQPYLVLLDTDTVFVDEPEFVRADVGVRPVDVKGSATGGASDALDAYWARLCGYTGIELRRLPLLRTSVDHVAIRASYNGGFTVVRRDLGILRRTKEIFFASFAENLRPFAGRALDIHASTGSVGFEASEWWGASQAALSVAIWSVTSDVHVYDARYNIPVHLLVAPVRTWQLPPGRGPVLVHYHYLAEPQHQEHLRCALRQLGCPADVLHWLEEGLARFGPAPAPAVAV